MQRFRKCLTVLIHLIITLQKLANPEAIITQAKLITEKLFSGFTYCLEKK